MRHRRSVVWLALGSALLPGVGERASAQERVARLAGTVREEVTSAPLSGVSVTIRGTAYGAVTGADGRYAIPNAPSGIFTIEARRIGYGFRQQENVRLRADSTVSLDFALSSNPLRLSEVVVSASVDPISGTRAPFTVAKLDAETHIPVKPNTSAAGAIQGKVAGAKILKASGEPGSGVFVQLRSPVSQFQSNSPLYVVDGIPLNSQQAVVTADIESMDIESVEVIKGAAAASLYGSRAAGGVISITTNRGKNLALGSTQLAVRSEFGFNQFARKLQKPRHHQFLVNQQGQYINSQGVVVPRSQRVTDSLGIMDNAYVDPLYDHADQFFKAGQFQTQNFSLTQNTAATNFNLAFNRYREEGVVVNSTGLTRQNIRLNVDHRIRDVFSVGLSAFHNRSRNDVPEVTWSDFFRFAPDIDLASRNPDGTYVIRPDSTDARTNPLYRLGHTDNEDLRMRTLLSANASFRPFSWLSIDGLFSYDRGDRETTEFTQRGITQLDGEGIELGNYEIDDDDVDGVSAQLGATATRAFGRLTSRLTARGETQREKNQYFFAQGQDFSVAGIRDIDAARTYTNQSSFTDRRAIAGYVSLGLDYDARYVGDFLIRREGNSLFGPANRWNYFYRASGAYLPSEERWWPFADLTSVKLRYSMGTAGVRPGFSDQYENLEFSGGGNITRQSFGNNRLRPEIATEREVGLDMIYKNRISASVVYARVTSDFNIISAPLPALYGYNTQEQNIGKTTGNTFEGTIQAQILNDPRGFQWEVNLVADRSRNKVAEFNRSCFTDGIFLRCEGNRLGEMWGNRIVRSFNQLPAVHASSRDAFQIDDNGYLVPVGVGNSYKDGVAKRLWGTTIRIDGRNYAWGRPFWELDSLNQRSYVRIGDSNPDLNLGIGNTFRWKSFTLYGLFTGQIGGDIYNNIRQGTYASGDHEDLDQSGKPEELKKPVTYYSVGLADNNNNWASPFVEDGTYLKLSELSLRYDLPAVALSPLRRIGGDRAFIQIIGRNVFFITDYTGLDPEAGSVLSRVEDNVYPQTRTWTGVVNITF